MDYNEGITDSFTGWLMRIKIRCAHKPMKPSLRSEASKYVWKMDLGPYDCDLGMNQRHQITRIIQAKIIPHHPKN